MPDATLATGQSFQWHGDATIGGDTLVGPAFALTGKPHDTRLIRLSQPGTFTVTVQNPATSYLLLEVRDAAGGQVAYSEGLPGEEVTVTASLPAGDYVVDVGYFAAVRAAYDASASLS